MDCGFISQKLRGFSAKGKGTVRATGQVGHVAAQDWRVHGLRGGPRGRGVVHRSTVDRGGGAGGGAMAASAELTTVAREGSASRAKRTGGPCASRRTRGARWPRRGTAETRRPRGGTAPCRRRNYGEHVRAAERGERERKASARSSPRCEARAGVLVVADSPTREIDGGAEIHLTAAAMAARGSSTRGDGCCPRVSRGARGSRHGL